MLFLARYRIAGDSMVPDIPPGKTVLASGIPYLLRKPKKDDVVLVRDPRSRRTLLKRITQKNKRRYFVMGDNKNRSTDSRHFGWVSKRDIIGMVFFVL